MTVLQFNQWIPDQAPFGNPGALKMLNTLPDVVSYKPFRAHSALTDALTAYARGAIHVRDDQEDIYQFAGDETKLYRLVANAWTDASRLVGGAYASGSEERWEFAKFKNVIIATNYDDELQSMDIAGSNFVDLTSDFRARRIAVVSDHLVACNTFDVTDNEKPDRVRWSGFEDETDWTASPTTGAGIRDLKGEPIQQIFGGQYGIINSLTDTYRMDYVGPPAFFRIDLTLPGYGQIAPGAATRIGERVYAWTNQGFVEINAGTSARPLGADKVDDFAAADVNSTYLYRITAAADPKAGRVFWSYPSVTSTAGTPDRILCYDINLQKWSLIEQTVEMIWSAGSGTKLTLDQLTTVGDLDSLPASLDSSIWKGSGVLLLAAFDTDNKHGFFTGNKLSAVCETKEVELLPGSKTLINAFRALIDGGSVTARIGYRNTLTDDVQYTSVFSPQSSGILKKRLNARYMRFELTLADDWREAIGTRLERKDYRKASGRGG